jgi:hypothetical protein
MASLVLRPQTHPIPGETTAQVLRRAVRATLALGDNAVAKAALIAWFVAVAAAPRPLAAKLLALRFVPTSRPKLVGAALRRLRVLRPPRPTEDLSVPRAFATS